MEPNPWMKTTSAFGMERDNIASANCPGLSSLDIAPTEIETIVSAVLHQS
jgi:hypothetical protein